MKKRKSTIGFFDMQAMGDRIKSLCEKKGLKPENVREALGLGTVQSVYRWYRGETIPEIEHLYLLSLLLEVTVDEFLIPRRIPP